MEKVNELLAEIQQNVSQRISSHKDEVRVMQAMLNDPSYEVTTYGTNGPTGTYNPCKEFRGMCASVISSAAKIPNAEATAMMESYNVRKGEAEVMVDIAKEFTHTYLHTGRKLPLGGREKSNISFSLKEVPETVRSCPHKVGMNDDGSSRYSRKPTTVKAHEAVRVYAPCPDWVK